ncbi:ATP-binding protein [Streptacidiphilus sp. ASG 303]|uniref:AAA family ATPase n=1 Tax=Streptacidiphilus sp. ASG 303 TaxID=2896847 RepID=UPI001E308996|nr:AAA family ATPase [Streptacidiphilus sp. ASG 303]MCD0485211.1 ATP-binding protein [Streptacidiphilus sp. ASG 303]
MVTTDPIRIAVCGTHSTGKTTLLQRLAMEFRAQGLIVARTAGSLAQKAADMGFPKMRAQSATTTQWIVAAGVCAEAEAALRADVVLIDRSALDPIAYYTAGLEHRAEDSGQEAADRLTAFAAAHAAGYTLLLATVLDPAVPLGEHRDRDLGYRARVDRHLHALLAGTGLPHLQVTNHDASRDAALDAALDTADARVGAV